MASTTAWLLLAGLSVLVLKDGILGLGEVEKKNTKEQGWITLRKKLLMRKRRADGDFNLEDALDEFNDEDEFDLEDALDKKNDRTDEKNGGGGNAGGKSFSDDDLMGVVDSGYSPDNPRSKGNTDDRDTTVNIQETTTIAGIASALAMALIGAVTSYISYQQKKFCFSIQRKDSY
ncbi:C99L2 protein, partial [Polypterus senegalus]